MKKDLDVGRGEGDEEIHIVDEDEDLVAEAAAWTWHSKTDTVNVHRAVDGVDNDDIDQGVEGGVADADTCGD